MSLCGREGKSELQMAPVLCKSCRILQESSLMLRLRGYASGQKTSCFISQATRSEFDRHKLAAIQEDENLALGRSIGLIWFDLDKFECMRNRNRDGTMKRGVTVASNKSGTKTKKRITRVRRLRLMKPVVGLAEVLLPPHFRPCLRRQTDKGTNVDNQ